MKKFLIPSLVVLMTLTSLIIVGINRTMNISNEMLKHKVATCSKSLDNHSKHLEMLYKCKPYKIGSDIEIRDEEGSVLMLSEIFGSSPKLVVRFSEINCINCISDEMLMISEYPELKSSTICLATYHKQDDLLVSKRMSGISNTVYNIPYYTFDCVMEELKQPYYFIVDENNYASHFFVAHLEDVESTKRYLEYVVTLLK